MRCPLLSLQPPYAPLGHPLLPEWVFILVLFFLLRFLDIVLSSGTNLTLPILSVPTPHCSYLSKDPERQRRAPVGRFLEASAAAQVPPLSDAWEERPLLPPHTRLPGAASPAPIAPFPRASPLPVPSHLHLRPSLQAWQFQVHLPGGTRRKRRRKEEGGR